MFAGYYDSALLCATSKRVSAQPDGYAETFRRRFCLWSIDWYGERLIERGNDGRSNAGTSGRGSKEARSPEWFPFNSPSTLMLVIIRKDCSRSLVLRVPPRDYRSKHHKYNTCTRRTIQVRFTRVGSCSRFSGSVRAGIDVLLGSVAQSIQNCKMQDLTVNRCNK